MSVLDDVHAVSRAVVSTYLRVLRLPVTVAARASGQQENETWPPKLTYEDVESRVETVLGSLLRDVTLFERGRLRRAKVRELRRAAGFEKAAADEQAEGESQFASREERIEEKRDQVASRAQERKREVGRQAGRQERDLKQQASKQYKKAQAAKASQDESIARRERSARAQVLAAESKALRTEKAAAQTADAVEAATNQIEATKRARKTS